MLEFLIIPGILFLIILLNKQKRAIAELQSSIRATYELVAKLKNQIEEGAINNPSTPAKETAFQNPIVPDTPPAAVVMQISEEETPPTIIPEPIAELHKPNLPQEVTDQAQPHTESFTPAEATVNTYTAPKVFVKSKEQKPSWMEQFKQNNPDIEKFIGENLINKIGILILVLGISFFVKYAIDKDWINEPARVGIGILCGGILIGIAHRLRHNYKAFSSVFVAGGIAIFYFTTGIAFHDYHLFSQTTAFVLMVLITLFSIFVAIMYDRQELIILSTIGGFAVPFMVSTGAGNFHVLFVYLTILNIGLLIISYFKRWFGVNFIAFLFTTIIYSYWHFDKVFDHAAYYPYALLYSSIFYIIFSIAFLLHAIIRKTKLIPYDIAAFILNTAIYYGLAFGVMTSYLAQYRGIFTLSLAAYNLIYALVLFKKYRFDFTVVYVLIGIALTFATITVPVQFNGNYITIFWACESVMLLWLAQKSGMKGFALSALTVQALSLISLVMDWNIYNNMALLKTSNIFINKIFITGITVILSLIANYTLFKRHDYSFKKWQIVLISNHTHRNILLWFSIVLGYLVPIIDICHFVPKYFENQGTIYFLCYLFHVAYTTAFVYVGYRQPHALSKKIATIIVGLNIVLYLVSAYRFPTIEQLYTFHNGAKQISYAFWLHYITVAALVYQLITCMAYLKKEAAFNRFYAVIGPWIQGFVIVFMASAETNIIARAWAHDVASFNTAQTFSVKVILPILWGILSFILLINGIRRNIKMLRIVALSLLGFTIIKLFIYDIKNVSETGKIIAFTLLGVLILIISFVYQKIKRLVIDNKENTTNHDEA